MDSISFRLAWDPFWLADVADMKPEAIYYCTNNCWWSTSPPKGKIIFPEPPKFEVCLEPWVMFQRLQANLETAFGRYEERALMAAFHGNLLVENQNGHELPIAFPNQDGYNKLLAKAGELRLRSGFTSYRFLRRGDHRSIFRNGDHPLKLRHDLRQHSWDFEWGYGGSGPSQAALAVLADYTRDDEWALQHYQAFKRAFIAAHDSDGWVLSGRTIGDWAREARHTN